MTGYRKPHPYEADAAVFGCRRCARLRHHRIHQPLWWRILHPSAKWR